MAVADGEAVRLEGTRRGPGGAVALVVELAAVARAAEARRLRRDESHLACTRVLGPSPARERGPVWLCRAPDVRAAARHDREARHRPEQTVVAHVEGAARDLARLPIGQEGGDDELPLGERRDRA